MAAPGTVTKNDNGTVMFTTLMGCMGCGLRVSVDQLDPGALEAYQANMGAVQDLFPRLSASEREALMTGTHAECWDAVAGGCGDDDASACGWPEDDDACAYCEAEAEGLCVVCGRPVCAEHGGRGDGQDECYAR